MLVDLARNDLGRVSAPGTVEVVEFGAVERYSHVWHIVSTVQGEVAAGKDAFDVLTATFPAGTLTGAPKVRAMELIEELEPVRRGIYGGAVGYLDAAGDLDMAIAIRTAVVIGRRGLRAGRAPASSPTACPALEEQETRNKARAVLQAIATAETLRPVRDGGTPASDHAAARAVRRRALLAVVLGGAASALLRRRPGLAARAQSPAPRPLADAVVRPDRPQPARRPARRSRWSRSPVWSRRWPPAAWAPAGRRRRWSAAGAVRRLAARSTALDAVSAGPRPRERSPSGVGVDPPSVRARRRDRAPRGRC